MGAIKRFYCNTDDLCGYKEEFVPNKRCFAPYTVRSTCRYLKRMDGKSWAQGSEEIEGYEKLSGGIAAALQAV